MLQENHSSRKVELPAEKRDLRITLETKLQEYKTRLKDAEQIRDNLLGTFDKLYKPRVDVYLNPESPQFMEGFTSSLLFEELKKFGSDLRVQRERIADTTCKVRVLEGALEEGGAEVHILKQQLQQELGTQFKNETFDNAVGVISKYIAGQGSKVSGGTGLQER